MESGTWTYRIGNRRIRVAEVLSASLVPSAVGLTGNRDVAINILSRVHFRQQTRRITRAEAQVAADILLAWTAKHNWLPPTPEDLTRTDTHETHMASNFLQGVYSLTRRGHLFGMPNAPARIRLGHKDTQAGDFVAVLHGCSWRAVRMGIDLCGTLLREWYHGRRGPAGAQSPVIEMGRNCHCVLYSTVGIDVH